MQDIFSVFFVCFVYFVCIFNIFRFYTIIFSLLYLIQILKKKLYQWGNSEAYLEPSGTSKMKLFMKIING